MPNTRQLAKRRLFLLVLIIFMIPVIAIGASHQPPAAESTATTTTSSIPSDLFKIKQAVVIELVNNRTAVSLEQSAGNLSYYIVRSIADKQALGLVYYTNDIAPEWTYGYASNVGMLVYVDTNGTIQGLNAYRIAYESYADRITPEWYQTLINRNVYEPLVIGQDIQGMTSATRTCTAIVNGVREAGKRVVDDYKNTRPQVNQNSIAYVSVMLEPKSLAETLTLIALYASAIAAYEFGNTRIKYAVMGAAVIFIGFHVGRMISIVDLTQLPIAGLPPFFTNTYWYALFGLTLLTSILWGRLYCGYLCPFGVFTQIVHDISPFKLAIPSSIHRKLVYAKYFVLVAVVVGIALGDFWINGIEPFQTFFFLTGQWWMWLIMGAAVITSIPAERFFCRYLCPAGAVLSLIGGIRLEEIRRWPECGRCLVCQSTCPTGAIVGSEISALQCMNCRECEKNYLDVRLCPHYRLERTTSERQA